MHARDLSFDQAFDTPRSFNEARASLPWGMLGVLAGRTFAAGAYRVTFAWSHAGRELHVRYGNAARSRPDRHVVITQAEDEFWFGDACRVYRGCGRPCSDGSVWFYDVVPLPGCSESGAIYRVTADGRFERQRHYTRDGETTLEPAQLYVPAH